MKNLKLSTKLYAVIVILVIVAVTIGVIGIIGMGKTNAGIETVYSDRVVPLEQLKLIADDYAILIIDEAHVRASDTVQRQLREHGLHRGRR